MKKLTLAAKNGDMNELYNVINQEPKILEQIDEIPFEQTPLHTAAAIGQTHFAIEIMSLKPSFAKKLNPDGYSPLHLAIQNSHTKTALKLVKLDRGLIRVQGKGRITPLHSVVQTEEKEILAEFLLACPHCIEDLTTTGETAVHVAVKMGWVQGFKVLFGWICRMGKTRVLNYEDDHGNTVLHLAALDNQPQLPSYQAALTLSPPGGLWGGEATPSTAATKITTTTSNFIGVSASTSKSTSSLHCSIAQSIAWAFNRTSHLPKRPGKVEMPPLFFNLFLIFNTFAVTASVGMIFLVLKTSRLSLLLHFSLAFLMLSYMISVLSISPSCNALPPILIAIQFCIISSFCIPRSSVYFIQKGPLAAWSSRYSHYYRALHQCRVVSATYM